MVELLDMPIRVLILIVDIIGLQFCNASYVLRVIV